MAAANKWIFNVDAANEVSSNDFQFKKKKKRERTRSDGETIEINSPQVASVRLSVRSFVRRQKKNHCKFIFSLRWNEN